MPKMLTGMNQNGEKPVISADVGNTGTRGFRSRGSVFPVRVSGREHGKPNQVPETIPGRQSQDASMPEWVEESGKSERPPVMGGIGVEPNSDIALRESVPTSRRFFIARRREETLNKGEPVMTPQVGLTPL